MGYKAIPEQFSFDLEDKSIYPEANAVGTAMSFGVDSFYTYIQGLKSIEKINCLTLFNAGAFGQYGGEKSVELFEGMKTRVKGFAGKNNMGFVWVDTNLNEIFKMPFEQTSIFRNFACVFLLQKMFKSYFYASSATLKDFKLNKNDTKYYELLISKALKGNSLNFQISGLTEGRINKTKTISNNEITFDNLNVCLITPDNKDLKDNKNCSKCFKCARTMLTLDIIGELEKYSNVFDLTIFKANKSKNIGDLIYRSMRMKDKFAIEIFIEMKKEKYPIPITAYKFLILRGVQPLKNIFKKNA
jgi:hypothetical protein